MKHGLLQKVVCEFVGTAFLLVAIVGSGIMGERLSGGNVAVALLGNSIATGAALLALILSFGPISGAHFNPAVSLSAAAQGRLGWRQVPSYLAAQIAGAFTGVACANAMFKLPFFFASTHVRSGWDQVLSEALATFGLMTVIWACVRYHSNAVPYAVAAYVTAAYWFASSTSLANPAVTMARAATDTFSGIRPKDVPAFIVAQTGATAVAIVFLTWLRRPSNVSAGDLRSEKAIAIMKKRILFLCTGNSARSQMAEGLMRKLAGEKYDVFSAGTSPKGLHPISIDVMKELDVDVSNHTSKDMTSFLSQPFDYVITVCDRAKQQCPIFPGAEPIHWGFEDPADAPPERQLMVFRQVRNEILQRIRLFLASHPD